MHVSQQKKDNLDECLSTKFSYLKFLAMPCNITTLLRVSIDLHTGPPVKKKSPPLSDKSSNKNASSNAGSQNLTDSFQFPVVPDDESSSNGSSDKDEAFQPPATSPLQAKLTQQQPGNPQQQQQRHVPDLTRKPSASALKKSPSTSSEGSVQLGGARKKRAPAFNDRYI